MLANSTWGKNTNFQKKSQVQCDFAQGRRDFDLKKEQSQDGQTVEGAQEIQGSSRKGYTVPLDVGENA